MIGIFDSGFGGLTVLKEILKHVPQYSYTYFGDNARMPYGNKSEETIYRYTREAVDFLASKGCKLIIFACNTASAKALRKIQQEYLPQQYPAIKVLGVIRPTVEIALEQSKNKAIGVVATRATVNSEAYVHELQKLDPDVKVYQQACPLLVPLIEEGWEKKAETRTILKKYLLYIESCHIDTLILACTHYPILQKDFERNMGKNVKIISSAATTAEKLVTYLQHHPEIEQELLRKEDIRFYTSDDVEKFIELGSRFLGRKIKQEEVNLLSIDEKL